MIDELIDDAVALAVAHGHARVTEAHVRLALLEHVDATKRMSERSFSAARLQRHARTELASEREGRAYRDPTRPIIEPSLIPSLRSIRAPGVLGLLRSPNAGDILEALVERRGLGAEITFDPAPVARIYDAAVRVADQRRHRNVLIHHAFIALAQGDADGARFARALEHIGQDADHVAASLARDLARGTISEMMPKRRALVRRATAYANVFGREELDPRSVVVQLMQSVYARSGLGRIGVDRSALIAAYVHGTAPTGKAVPSFDGPAEVVFHDDDFTTQEVVMRLLSQHFHKSEDEARRLMLRVHRRGEASFPVEDGKEAAGAVGDALAECAELGMPLRIELRPLPVGPE